MNTAKLIFYTAFIDGKLEAPRSLLPEVHRLYFEPQYPEFSARTMWSLSNAFTSTFKKLDPVPQFKATAKLGGFLAQLPAQSKVGPVLSGDHPERVRLFQCDERLGDTDPSDKMSPRSSSAIARFFEISKNSWRRTPPHDRVSIACGFASS
jgi:hypothetical protein